MSATPPFDADKFKDATRAQWNTHAKGWSDHSAMIREWLRPATDAMLAMAAIGPGARVLDVAAGAGDQTLDILARVGPTGFVVASDLSPAILEFAEERARQAGYTNLRTLTADGENLNVADAEFDAAVCRLGLMFFPDPARGLREIYRALKRGGRACTMVFSTPEANPCVRILMQTALRHAGLPPRDPYTPGSLLSLGKPGLADKLFRSAGFGDVATTRLSAPLKLPTVQDYLEFIKTSASPVIAILNGLDTAAREAAWAEIEEQLDRFTTSAGWEGPNELLLTAGRKK